MLPNTQFTIHNVLSYILHTRAFTFRARHMYVLLNELKNCSEMFYEVSRCQNIPRDSTCTRHIRRGAEIPNSGTIRIWV